MQINCLLCGNNFQFEADEQEFTARINLNFGSYSATIPPPCHCPNCRLQIRTAHRNEQYLYHTTCAGGSGRIISLYAPDPPWGAPFKVYHQEFWHSDRWNGLEYGREFDFSKTFFEQFAQLQKDVPRIALVTVCNENSPYTTGTGYCRNCYLITCSEHCENCYYGKLLQSCRDCVDCSYAYNSELCYQCLSIYNCYGCRYLSFGYNSNDCWFSENLVSCSNCLFCCNLQHQKYCVFNKELSREEFHKTLSEITGSYRKFSEAEKVYQKLRRERIHKYAHILRSEKCRGDFITNSKNCIDCYDVNDSEDCRYICLGVNIKNCYDCSNLYLKQELNYQILGSIGTYNCAFSIYVFHSNNTFYSDHIYNSHDLFGCVGLKHHNHCILNRQYSEKEYNSLAGKIIEHMKKTGEWGQFFPPSLSPFTYNESLANDYFPMSKEQVLSYGWNWREEKQKDLSKAEPFVLPDQITQTPDDICSQVLSCLISGEQYKIIPQELDFYRKNNIPVPRHSPMQRHRYREGLRNKRRSYSRHCDCCKKAIFSSFASTQPEKIYCEECYLENVF